MSRSNLLFTPTCSTAIRNRRSTATGAAAWCVVLRLLVAGLLVAGAFGCAANASAADDGPPGLPELCQRVKPPYVFISGGSGVVITPDGLMLTNSHVIGNGKQFDVRLGNGRHAKAKLLGRDVDGDLALLQLEQKGDQPFPHLELGDSDKLQVGDYALAIGNPFGIGFVDQHPTFTLGVISAVNHFQGNYPEAIVTDAEVNPGNSGGPLINLQGQVVGINGQISTRWGLRSNTGLGYAISANQIRIWIPRLKAAGGGDVAHGKLPGIDFERAALESPQSLKIKDVAEGSPAADAGLKPGDTLVKFDGKPVASAVRLASVIGIYPEEHEVTIEVERDGQTVPLKAKLVRTRRGQLGFKLKTPAKEDPFVKVGSIEKDSPAEKAGLKVDDEIVEVEGNKFANVPSGLQFRLVDGWMKNGVTAGDVIKFSVRRKNDKGEPVEQELRLIAK